MCRRIASGEVLRYRSELFSAGCFVENHNHFHANSRKRPLVGVRVSNSFFVLTYCVAMGTQDEMRLQAVLHEFNFVSGLIPMYREVEARALSTVGLVLAGVGTVVAALMQVDNPDPQVQGGLISFTAWIFALFSAVHLTAQLRILRASEYIKRNIYPELDLLLGKRVIAFETTLSEELIGASRQERGFKARIKRRLVTSVATAVALGLTGLVLPFVGAFAIAHISVVEAMMSWWFLLGLAGGICSAVIGWVGVSLSSAVERS